MSKTAVESVSKCALDFEKLSYKLELTIVQGCTMVNDWHMLVSIKILARILMFHIGCTFGELRQLRIAKVRKFFSVQNSFST